MLRKFDTSNIKIKDKCIAEIITRIEEIDVSEVGIIAAQDIIDIVTQNLGPEIYNTALKDTRKLILERYSDLETELELLKQ